MTDMSIYAKRRERLLKELGKGVAILKGAPEQTRSHDTEYPYRQDSDLFYLTGYTDPGAAMILDPNNEENPFTLFVLPKDPKKEVWTGRRLSFEETKEVFGANMVLDIAEFDGALPKAMTPAAEVYTNLNHDVTHQHRMLDHVRTVRGAVQRTGGGPEGLRSIGALLHAHRLIKDDHEIALIQKASDISAEAHIKAMKAVKPGMYEYQLQAIMESHFVYEGGAGPAYTSIVGAGDNATVLHYIKNRDQIKEDDLVLIDAATEYEMYASDITRTFPAQGRFNDSQKELYEVVLHAQKEVLAACKPGVTFQELHDLDLRLLVEGMVKVGLLEGEVDTIIEEQTYQDYFMHKTGHWLGLDVHDMGKYMREGDSVKLEPGMVFTIEPGIYVHSQSKAPERFRGIGIRIEDDILITEDGYHNFTSAVPKEIDEIEALMAENNA